MEQVDTHTVEVDGESYTFNQFYDRGDVVFRHGEGDESIEIRIGEEFSSFVDTYSFDFLRETVGQIISGEVE